MTKRVTIIDVKDYVGQEVTIGAWVANKSGKGKIAFLHFSLNFAIGTRYQQASIQFKPLQNAPLLPVFRQRAHQEVPASSSD